MNKNLTRIVIAGCISSIAAFTGWASWAQPGGSNANVEKRAPMQEAIKTIPGFVGMKSTRISNDQEISFIWFKDKASVLEWYHSPAHQEVMNKYFGDRELREPLTNIPDGSGPLLVVASFTRAKEPQKLLPLFSQFAIEIFQPSDGGLFVGGTFAPKQARASNLREFTATGAD